jgi:hypothetical protein
LHHPALLATRGAAPPKCTLLIPTHLSRSLLLSKKADLHGAFGCRRSTAQRSPRGLSLGNGNPSDRGAWGPDKRITASPVGMALDGMQHLYMYAGRSTRISGSRRLGRLWWWYAQFLQNNFHRACAAPEFLFFFYFFSVLPILSSLSLSLVLVLSTFHISS